MLYRDYIVSHLYSLKLIRIFEALLENINVFPQYVYVEIPAKSWLFRHKLGMKIYFFYIIFVFIYPFIKIWQK